MTDPEQVVEQLREGAAGFPTAESEGVPKKSSYGDFECGCDWDSGPYERPCERHDPDRMDDELHALAADTISSLIEERDALGALFDQKVQKVEELLDEAEALRKALREIEEGAHAAIARVSSMGVPALAYRELAGALAASLPTPEQETP